MIDSLLFKALYWLGRDSIIVYGDKEYLRKNMAFAFVVYYRSDKTY